MPNLPSLDWSLATAWLSEVLELFWPALAVLLGVSVGVWIFVKISDAVRGPDHDSAALDEDL